MADKKLVATEKEEKKDLTFEEKLKALEEIATKIENNDNLDESIKLYAKGTILARECFSELETANGKITEIKNGEEEANE